MMVHRSIIGMAKFSKKFETIRDDWETPQWLFDHLDAEFCFTCDVAATEGNAKVSYYLDKSIDALGVRWEGVCWLNPPYGRQLAKWVKKAYEEALYGAIVVVLIPARTNTVWWHKYCMKGAEIRFLLGRPKFKGAEHGLPQPLAIVVFDNSRKGLVVSSLDVRFLA